MSFIFLQALNIVISFIVNYTTPKPYMDEQFHMDQMQHYYDGHFTYWNDKLTTPPMLYILNYPILKVFSYFNSNLLLHCRLLNTFFYGNITYYIMMKLTTQNRAILFCLLPTIYFYNHLFYTDPLSLSLLLLAYYFCIKKANYLYSALFCLMSLLTRQTSIIWLLFICLKDFLQRNKSKLTYKDPRLSMFFYIQAYFQLIFSNFGQIIKIYKYHIVICVLFLYFWLINGSLVLGDKSNHQIIFHGAQILYLSVVLTVYLPLNYGHQLKYLNITYDRIKQSRNAKTTYVLIALVSFILVNYFSYVHPFILSDNRHYIFYIYRKIILKFSNSLCLLYAFIIVFLTRVLISHKDQTINFIITVFFAVISIAFSGLIEPRYFTAAVMYFYLEIPTIESNLTINKILFAVSNIILFAIFGFVEFQCDFDQCRFMF